jgi:cobalt-zinc-cadmium efflux system outer membrane protein
MKLTVFWSAVLVLAAGVSANAQTTAAAPTPLASLVTEAQANNPQVSAANHAWKAATHVARQVTTLADPKFTVQQFSVGSPKPFAGYTNSDFAYIGVGGSQELPFPGKLKLRGKVADRNADIQYTGIEIAKKDIADAVKSDYLQLAYLQGTLIILKENEAVLGQLIQDALVHYQVGQGLQENVLQAQVGRTKLVRDITLQHQQVSEIEAHLKGLLHRDQGSPDIEPEQLTQTTLRLTSTELLDLVRRQNPELRADESSIRKQDAQVLSAEREGRPDFDLGYMYQNTDRKYRDYYMLTFDVRLPRRKRVHEQIAEAVELLAQSKDALDEQLQQQLAATQQQYVQVTSDAELLTEYREGLIPQSDATYRATLTAYAANRAQFLVVLQYFNDLLSLKLDFAKTLADHETALAHLESLTGATLR